MVNRRQLSEEFKGKRVFITGHTGFKGSWLTMILYQFGAIVKGYALPPKTEQDIFYLIQPEIQQDSIIADVRDKVRLAEEIIAFQPDFIFHLAAQPLVGISYKEPHTTIEVNVMGTVNLFEAIRKLKKKCTTIIITTDKVYKNQHWHHPYRESDVLGGYDPYSASKSASELIIESYRDSFFNVLDVELHGKAIAVARAGNVIGGGDYSEDRLIPDIIRSIQSNSAIGLRNPSYVRPWQHVLDALNGYLILASSLNLNPKEISGAWNFGPNATDLVTVNDVVQIALSIFGKESLVQKKNSEFHETELLMLDNSRAKNKLNWNPIWNPKEAIIHTLNWYLNPSFETTVKQINHFYEI
jgi:CDP-glucose 4,6-dehydratase